MNPVIDHWKHEHLCNKNCPFVPATKTQPLCAASKTTVAKIIRFCDGKLLAPLLDQLPGLFIVFQVRDPRGIYFSRLVRGLQQKHIGQTPEVVMASMLVTCNSLVDNYVARYLINRNININNHNSNDIGLIIVRTKRMRFSLRGR